MESSTEEFKMKDLCGVTDSDVGKPTIGVIGTGNFAVALTKCLLMVGYDVIIGSRRLHYLYPWPGLNFLQFHTA